MIVYDFNGHKVPVTQGQVVLVITSPLGDCVSTLPYDQKIEHQIQRGVWDDSFVYEVSGDKGVKVLCQPVSHGDDTS